MMSTRTVAPASDPPRWTCTVPGDKSISHRLLFFGTFAPHLHVDNLAPGDDVARTRSLIESAGYRLVESAEGVSIRRGERSSDPFAAPVRIECGNSGTTARLGLGWLSGHQGLWKVTGDASLKGRPMGRVLDPLRRLGVEFRGGPDKLPVSVIATEQPGYPRTDGSGESVRGGRSEIPTFDVTSAQVHASLVLAGLQSVGGLRLRRTRSMRDHTLRLVRLLGLPVETSGETDLVGSIADHPDPLNHESPLRLKAPGDFSSASFLITAALLQPGAEITIDDVSLNRTRTAFLDALALMGADVTTTVVSEEWEPRGTIVARGGGGLRGGTFSRQTVDIDGMADEIPLLALLAAIARGPSTISDAGELRVKESDRIATTATVLQSLGLPVIETPDGFRCEGGGRIGGGVSIDPRGDHRIAMLAGVAGRAADAPIEIQDSEVASVSWPGFWESPLF